jgi:hypothetical protein
MMINITKVLGKSTATLVVGVALVKRGNNQKSLADTSYTREGKEKTRTMTLTSSLQLVKTFTFISTTRPSTAFIVLESTVK